MRAGAVVERAILDDRVEVGSDARVGGPGGELTLVGLQAAVGEGETIAPGARFPEPEE